MSGRRVSGPGGVETSVRGRVRGFLYLIRHEQGTHLAAGGPGRELNLVGGVRLEPRAAHQAHVAVMKAKDWLQAKTSDLPALGEYLANWGDWQPWP